MSRTNRKGGNAAAPADKVAAATAHVVGPGVLRVRNRMPCWEPIDGPPVLLHPEHLRTLIIHGHGDLTGQAVRLLWRHGVQVNFVNSRSERLEGSVSPPARNAPSLACLQHWALEDSQFALRQARSIVCDRIRSIMHVGDHWARHGAPQLRRLRQQWNADLAAATRAATLAQLRGHEGAAAARWHRALGDLVPEDFTYPGRRYRPPTDPVNALLSLGYTLLLARVQAAIATTGLDPLIGCLHQPRAGKPALACDLMEPFRAPVVDQLVLAQLRQKFFLPRHFRTDPKSGAVSLLTDHYRRFLRAFEQRFCSGRRKSFQLQLHDRVQAFASEVRKWARSRPRPSTEDF